MIKSSVFYAVTFFFSLASVSIFLAFLWLNQYDKQKYTNELNAKYSFVANATLLHLQENINKNDLIRQISGYQMDIITDNSIRDFIINSASIIQKIKTKIGTSSILRYKKNHYLLVNTNQKSLLIKDNGFEPYRYDVIRLIFAGIFFITFLAYVLTIRKLKPLKKLKIQIEKFALGQLNDITCKTNGNDEIAEVANAFNNAISQIRKLNHSRQLFLRNIMHELKTPITKGLITAEMIPEDKNQQRLVRTFQKLEELINEFATVEQVSSGIMLGDKKMYRLVDLVDEAIDLSMCEKEHVSVFAEDINIKVNFKFFCIALKNMIDNGIKYSTNKHIKIKASQDCIEFISLGDALQNHISFYVEPFIQGNIKNKKSFGLGLYIVDNILKSHNLNLQYHYENGYNVFSFTNLQNIN